MAGCLAHGTEEQFVKVQILAIADGADLPVGEATVPIADPMAESMNSWWAQGGSILRPILRQNICICRWNWIIL